MMVDFQMRLLYLVLCHVVMRAVAGASGSKGRSRKSPIFFYETGTPSAHEILMARDTSTLVTIYDHSLKIASDSADSAHILKAADYLDQMMRSAAESAGRRSSLDIAILAAMEVAEKVLETRRNKESLLSEVDERISAFTRRLEEGDAPSADQEADSIPPPRPRF